MKIENVEVYGFRRALYGMRNPRESWARSDSTFYIPEEYRAKTAFDDEVLALEFPNIGLLDLELACKLIAANSAERKFLRQIMVWWDITIPRAVWQELDTYKVATVRNSCSTMHKLGSRDLTPDDFQNRLVQPTVLERLNQLGREHRAQKPKDPKFLHAMKMELPEGYLQQATYTFSYETALNMYGQRHNHRMPEWSGEGGICSWLLRLPYFVAFAEAVV